MFGYFRQGRQLCGFCLLKGSIFLKNRHIILQEKFNKLIYGINTILKYGTWHPVKFRLVSRSWNEIIFYRISVLMLPTLIQRCDKNHLIFDPVQKRETIWNFTGCQMPHFMIVLILYLNLLKLSWIKKNVDQDQTTQRGVWSGSTLPLSPAVLDRFTGSIKNLEQF